MLIIFYSGNVPFPVFPIFDNVVIMYPAIQFTNFRGISMLFPQASYPDSRSL